MMRIMLVDDHAILRQGLKQILAEGIADAEFGDADSAAQALSLLHHGRWDVLILDINLPGRNGFEVLTVARRAYPALPVLVLSSTPEDQLGLRALRAGAAGYLNKQAAPERLLEAVRQVLAGERYVSRELAQQLAAELARPDAARPRHELLSTRELQVARLSAQGRSVKQIAEELSLSAKTISTFRGRVFEKLQLQNDAELALYAREHGLLEP